MPGAEMGCVWFKQISCQNVAKTPVNLFEFLPGLHLPIITYVHAPFTCVVIESAREYVTSIFYLLHSSCMGGCWEKEDVLHEPSLDPASTAWKRPGPCRIMSKTWNRKDCFWKRTVSRPWKVALYLGFLNVFFWLCCVRMSSALRFDRESESLAATCANNMKKQQWLVVSTPLKNISQLGWLFHIIPDIWKNKQCSKPPTRTSTMTFQSDRWHFYLDKTPSAYLKWCQESLKRRCTHAHTHTRHIHTHAHTHTYAHTQSYIQLHINININIHIRIRNYTYIYICVIIYIYIWLPIHFQ